MQKRVQRRAIERQNKSNAFRKWLWRSTMLAGMGVFAASFHISRSDYKLKEEKITLCQTRNENAFCQRKIEDEQKSLHNKTLFTGSLGVVLVAIGSTMLNGKGENR
jgi:hypothetical protein